MNGFKIGAFENKEAGLIATVYGRGPFEFVVSLRDTDANESIGTKAFQTLDAANAYAERCVDWNAPIGSGNWVTFTAVTR